MFDNLSHFWKRIQGSLFPGVTLSGGEFIFEFLMLSEALLNTISNTYPKVTFLGIGKKKIEYVVCNSP